MRKNSKIANHFKVISKYALLTSVVVVAGVYFFFQTELAQQKVEIDKTTISPNQVLDVYALTSSSDARTPAAGCTTGMKEYPYEYNGKEYVETCPENCSDEADFPGFNKDNPGTFSRTQDTTGTCRSFSGGDYICYQLRRLNLWPTTGEYKKGCSVFDLELQAFKKTPKPKNKNTVRYFLGESINSDSVDNDPRKLVEIAQTVGVCPESLFPSDFRNNPHATLRKVYEQVQMHMRTMKKSEAGVSLTGFCAECSAVAPSLSNQQWKDIEKEIAKVKDLDTDDFAVLDKINSIACPPEKRIKLPKNIVDAKGNVIDDFSMKDHFSQEEAIQRLTKLDSIIVLEAHAHELDPNNIRASDCTEAELDADRNRPTKQKKCGNDNHSMVLFGTIVRNVAGKTTCLYAVKNSWGPTTCVTRAPDIFCDRDKGTYLLSKRMLEKIRMSYRW